MASLRARHSRKCKYGTTPYESAGDLDWRKDCACQPSYFVDFGIVDGRHYTEPAGRDRKVAQQKLNASRGEIAKGEFAPRKNIRFDEWADRWLDTMELRGRKLNTVRVYRGTLTIAKQVFGRKNVRDVTPADVERFLDVVAERGASTSTQAKHKRQLSACLERAVRMEYASRNPARHLSVDLEVPKSVPTYFTNAELSKLWLALEGQPLHLHLLKLACFTGLRAGELLALRPADVRLLGGELEVQRTFTARIGETTPKSGKGRIVDLTPPAAAVLESWFALRGNDLNADALLFGHETTGKHLDPSFLSRGILYPALERAGIPREGEHGRKRTFHSLRHSFARLVLEAGAPLTWCQRQMGHSSVLLTAGTYGRWSRESEKAEAQKLAGAFPV